jgi:hypothetical protein
MLPCYFLRHLLGEFWRSRAPVPIISKQSVTADAPGNLAFLKEQK